MSELTFWFGRSAGVLAAAAFAVFVVFLCIDRDGAGRRVLGRYVDGLDRKLRTLRARVSGKSVTFAQVGACSLLVGITVVSGEWLLALILPPLVIAPWFVIDQRVSRRTVAVESQLEAWLAAVANALKASASLGEAIASSARLVPAPMSEEVELVMKEYELGTPLDDAVERFAERVPSKTVAGAVLALKVARRSGGNLPEMLENASAALRELARLEGVVRSKTAEGKAQVFVVGVIPIPMIFGVRFSDPHFFEPIVHSFVGHLVIAGAIALWLGAILLARKILAVDV